MKRFLTQDLQVERILLACAVPPGSGAPVHKNRPAHGLVFYKDGEECYEFAQGDCMTVKQGDILFLPKGFSYTVRTVQEGTCYAINFNISEQLSPSPFLFRPKNARELQSAFVAAAEAWRAKRQGYTLRCKELLYRVLYQLQSDYHTTYTEKGKSELIAPAVAHIHAHYTAESLCIAVLAKMCGITPEYFRSVFRKFYGTSPLKYINGLRLSHAKDLILSGLYGVTEAAQRSGFSDASHFSREFKKHFGAPPATFKP